MIRSAGLAPIYALVGSARVSVDMVMYELDDPRFEAILAGDAQRGVDVRVSLVRAYVGSFDTPAATYLERHGVAGHWASWRYELTDEKSILVDDRVGLVVTLNLGAVRYDATSRDFAVEDPQPTDVAAMTTTFDADWTGAPITAPPGTDLPWSPGAQVPIVALIDSAKSTIALENEEMADPVITEALVAAARRGVRVRIVVTADRRWDSAPSELAGADASAGADVEVRTYRDTATGLSIHAKVVDADQGRRGIRVFVTSENFSWISLSKNRELGIITSSPAILNRIGAVMAHDLAGGTAWR